MMAGTNSAGELNSCASNPSGDVTAAFTDASGQVLGGGDVRVDSVAGCHDCSTVLWSTAIALARGKNADRGANFWPSYEYNAQVSSVSGFDVCDSPPCGCGKNKCECESWAAAMRASKWWCPGSGSGGALPKDECGLTGHWFPFSTPSIDAMANFYQYYTGKYSFMNTT